MAIFISNCAICNEKIDENTPCLATSGVAFIPPHPLYQFCDVGLHQKCLSGWKHRREFSLGYVNGSGLILESTEDYRIVCGPMGYGPNGKPGWPYYVEVRLCDWPVRLYSRFEDWESYLSAKTWESEHINEINEHIDELIDDIPSTNEKIQDLLWQPLVSTMLNGENYRSRYIATISLNLYKDSKVLEVIPELKKAKEDEHGSVRNESHLILKRLGKL